MQQKYIKSDGEKTQSLGQNIDPCSCVVKDLLQQAIYTFIFWSTTCIRDLDKLYLISWYDLKYEPIFATAINASKKLYSLQKWSKVTEK